MPVAHLRRRWGARNLNFHRRLASLTKQMEMKKLEQLGIDHEDATSMGNTRKGAWRISRTPDLNFALPLSFFVHNKDLLLLR